MEFTATGKEAWVSARDDDRVVVYDSQTFERRAEIASKNPSGIFFTWRATRYGL
jgi:protein NirF